jgi:ABC-type xylose transport system permease subunit
MADEGASVDTQVKAGPLSRFASLSSTVRAPIRAPRDSVLLLVLAAVWLFFYFATDGTFLTQRNLLLLALQTSIVSLAAINAVMLIVTRNFDLSVGSAVALVGVILALLTVKYGFGAAVGVAAAIAGGVVMGVWQGLWVARIGVSSFIVTLAGMLYFRGLSMIATNGATVAPLPDSLTDLATGFLPRVPSIAAILVAVSGYLLFGSETCSAPARSASRHESKSILRVSPRQPYWRRCSASGSLPAREFPTSSCSSPFAPPQLRSLCVARALAPGSTRSAEIRKRRACRALTSSASFSGTLS